jgi:Polysaccharide deacetylase
MPARRMIYLMYHELQAAGRPTCQSGNEYTRYVVSEAEFKNQLTQLRDVHFRGLNVTQAIENKVETPLCVTITFDDGCESDLLVGAASLKAAGFDATFYVIAGFFGRPGYMSRLQVRELSDLGFEVGCHSMTHCHLTGLGRRELQREIVEAKETLEQVIGRRVDHFSCPYGGCNRRVIEVAREGGYLSVATSVVGANSPNSDRYRLRRLAVMSTTSLGEFQRLCRGEGLLIRRSRQLCLSLSKHVLGQAAYDRIRVAILGGRPG